MEFVGTGALIFDDVFCLFLGPMILSVTAMIFWQSWNNFLHDSLMIFMTII